MSGFALLLALGCAPTVPPSGGDDDDGACEPGAGSCVQDGPATSCRGDGSGYDEFLCDSKQGLFCDFETGVCSGACSPEELARSYIGCEYRPTVTGNSVRSTFEFAVVVTNTSDLPADVVIEGGDLDAPIELIVPPRSQRAQPLPWVADLKACMGPCDDVPLSSSAVSDAGAYLLRSTRPVTVYQFSPLDYTQFGLFSYSNDASLLLPVNALDREYVVASYPSWGDSPSQLSVTAVADDTEVTIVAAGNVRAGAQVPAIAAGETATFALDAGDVVQLFAEAREDLTGSVVTASRDVQVIGGHYCTQIPHGPAACDHLEESMFPVRTLGTSYVVTQPAHPDFAEGKAGFTRIIAVDSDTHLVFSPPLPGVDTELARRGDFVEVPLTLDSFHIEANHRVVVAQYMQSQQAAGNTGDPAMTLAVPVEQYRAEYLFHAPTSYDYNYVNIVAPIEADIVLDGEGLPSPDPIGDTGLGVIKARLGRGAEGDHHIAGSYPFGIAVYGYGSYTSYWYPGGLNLEPIQID
jgi:hypothetical protein